MNHAGRMRQTVRIEQRSTTRDAAGEPLLDWTHFATKRASIDAVPGREIWSSTERQGRVPTLFRIRYLAGVVPAMRLIHKIDGVDRVFNIISATDPNGLRVELVLNTELIVEDSP